MEVCFNVWCFRPRVIGLIVLFFVRLYDILSRMVNRQPESRWEQLHVSLGVLGVLQYAVGSFADICDVGVISGYKCCVLVNEEVRCCEVGDGKARE